MNPSVARLCRKVHCSHWCGMQLVLSCPLCCVELCTLVQVGLGQHNAFRLHGTAAHGTDAAASRCHTWHLKGNPARHEACCCGLYVCSMHAHTTAGYNAHKVAVLDFRAKARGVHAVAD